MTSNGNNNSFDFGFGTEEFSSGGSLITPYGQFLNATRTVWGFAITEPQAEAIGFKPNDNWIEREHEFDNETIKLWYTQAPRFLIINQSSLFMEDVKNSTSLIYDKALKATDPSNYRTYSYLVIWFVDSNNKPLSDSPLRLKVKGRMGSEFNKFMTPNIYKAASVYQRLTGNTIGKDGLDIFKAHLIQELQLDRQTVGTPGQSSEGIVVRGITEYTTENFRNLIIPNGREFSDRIKEYREISADWIQLPAQQESPQANLEQTQTEGYPINNEVSSTPKYHDDNDFIGNFDGSGGQVPVKPVITKQAVTNTNQAAYDILNSYEVLDWTKEGLNAFLRQRYNMSIEQLGLANEIILAEIMTSLQTDAVRQIYCQNPADIPF